MEQPEKIYAYIPKDDIVGTASTQKGAPHRFVTTEYARTDAFIEKAKKWLYLQLNEINMEDEDMENFLKDFKSYMKGE